MYQMREATILSLFLLPKPHPPGLQSPLTIFAGVGSIRHRFYLPPGRSRAGYEALERQIKTIR